MISLIGISTRQFIFAALLVFVAAGICEFLDRLTWPHNHFVSHVFDEAGFVLFWSSYFLLWLLLVIGPFRPAAEFSLRGERGRRVANFFFALGALLLLHLYIAVVAYAAFA